MRLFYGILDQAGVNANILYGLAPKKAKTLYRTQFLHEITKSLITPHLHERMDIPDIRNFKKKLICEFLNLPVEPENMKIKFVEVKRRRKPFGAVLFAETQPVMNIDCTSVLNANNFFFYFNSIFLLFSYIFCNLEQFCKVLISIEKRSPQKCTIFWCLNKYTFLSDVRSN